MTQGGTFPSVETELLCLCARMTLDAEARARALAILSHQIDWGIVLELAKRHRVLPLLRHALNRLAPGAVPEAAGRPLHRACQVNASRNLFLTQELFEVMRLLHAHGIDSIPYKGPAIASLLYGDLSLRQFADLDVVVRVADVARAIRVLATRRYRLETDRSDAELRAYLPVGKDVTLLRDDGRVNLEIHWGMATEKDPIRIRPEWLWERLEWLPVAGTPVRMFGPDRLLLLLCIHGAKHRWDRLGWICDIAEFVRSQPEFDWDAALEDAAVLGGKRIFLLGLSLAVDLLGASPPGRIIDEMRADPLVKALNVQVMGWLFAEAGVSLDLGERERYFMRLRERRADRCRVALKQAKQYLAPTIRDREALPVPEYLKWSLYLLRPVRLAGEYGFAPVKRFFSGLFQA